MTWVRLRTVRLEDSAAEIVDSARQTHPRFGDAYNGLEWLLARSPERGINAVVDEVQWAVYVQGSDPLAKTPEIWVLYQYDDKEVRIYAINLAPHAGKENDETD